MRQYHIGYWVNGSPRDIQSALAETAEAAFKQAVDGLPALRHDPAKTRIKIVAWDGKTLIDRPADIAPPPPPAA